MSVTRPHTLTIAGFDPSGGAGVLADIKTLEANKAIGFGVVTALTFQNDAQFDGLVWVKTAAILSQIDVLFKKENITYVKIGMIENLDVLEQIITHLKTKNKAIKIIWDPILKASAGFEVHKTIEKEKLLAICNQLFLITPNEEEIKILMKEENAKNAATQLSKLCNVLLKGGHSSSNKGKDYLFAADKIYAFNPKLISVYEKHGTGCVLSSAIMARLARGNKLHKACIEGKKYVTKYLMSNKTLLGYHKI